MGHGPRAEGPSPSRTSPVSVAASRICSAPSSTGESGNPRRAPDGPRKGRNVEYVVEVGFETAVRGGRIGINLPITEECATCQGSGETPGSGSKSCSECKGSGTVSFGQGGFAVKRPCPACVGRGTIPEKPCNACEGTGTVRQTRKIQVTVPRGAENGSKVRLTGQGERGSLGGKRGDLADHLQGEAPPILQTGRAGSRGDRSRQHRPGISGVEDPRSYGGREKRSSSAFRREHNRAPGSGSGARGLRRVGGSGISTWR